MSFPSLKDQQPPLLLGKVTVVLNFLHLYTICLTGFVESKLFRDGFVTFSSLMSNINSFSELLRDLQWHDSLPQKWSDFDRSLFFE